jgi:hypothetical protein
MLHVNRRVLLNTYPHVAVAVDPQTSAEEYGLSQQSSKSEWLQSSERLFALYIAAALAS